MRLNERQTALLSRMCRQNIERDGAESGQEMVQAVWGTGHFTSYEQGQRTAEQLVTKGLAVKMGVSPSGVQCYGPSVEGLKTHHIITHGSK